MIHMFGSLIMFSSSTIYHLYNCHSKHTQCKLTKYDYAGVSVMIASSVYPPYVYGLMCDQTIHWAYLYLTIINVSALALVVICIHPSFDNEKYRRLRIIMYVIVGLACGVPGFHYQFFGNYLYHSYTNTFLWALGGFFFVFGAYIYHTRFPERKYPGKFDYFGQSHNIWHFFVLLGAFTHFLASLASYYGRRVQSCPV